MADDSPHKRLVGRNRTRPAVVVDCSESAVNAGVTPVATGRLVGLSHSRPAVVVDTTLERPAPDSGPDVGVPLSPAQE